MGTVARLPKAQPAPHLLQLWIELAWIKLAIWRRVVVPETITLPKLHHFIQAVMGWHNCHLHEFEIAGERYGVPDPDYDFEPIRNEQRVRLGGGRLPTNATLTNRCMFTYSGSSRCETQRRMFDRMEERACGNESLCC